MELTSRVTYYHTFPVVPWGDELIDNHRFVRMCTTTSSPTLAFEIWKSLETERYRVVHLQHFRHTWRRMSAHYLPDRLFKCLSKQSSARQFKYFIDIFFSPRLAEGRLYSKQAGSPSCQP